MKVPKVWKGHHTIGMIGGEDWIVTLSFILVSGICEGDGEIKQHKAKKIELKHWALKP